ncbi:MAG TPA: lytic transglycosylase domain-containing protein [Terriglobales bacterium]
MKLRIVQLAALLLVACSLHAAELAHLRNGFTIRHAAREVEGNNVRLFLDDSKSNYVDVASSDITGYEVDDSLPVQAPSPQPAPVASIDDHVKAYSAQQEIDPDFVASIIRQESQFNPKAVSPKGARGLMQLMPGTAQNLGVKDAFDPAANIDGGTRYLHQLFEQYNGDAVKALAAYNAGPHRVDQYKGVPPYRETRQYVAKIIRDYNRHKAAQQPVKTQVQAKKSVRKTTESR